jgi:histidinol-phosphate aminotransferase
VSIEELVNPHIRDLSPYVPGKSMGELERELGITSSIKLASNENPLGPSPKALAALRDAIDEVHRYPDGACCALRARLSEKLGVDENQLVFGCGADEILELICKTFVGNGEEVVMPWPSFAMYPIVVKGMGGKVVQVPLRPDFSHDLDAMLEAITEKTKLVFVCNPDNPTGTSIGAEAFDAFVAKLPSNVVLAVDEVYFEFVRRGDFPKTLELLRKRPATLVLRSFSKIYGLAGLRVGYGIGHPDLVGYLERARHPFNVNRLAEAAAVAALDDDDHERRTLALNGEGIEYLGKELTALGYEVAPTDTNFILVKTGASVSEALMKTGVIVRPMTSFGLPDYVRITIGLPEENQRLVKELRALTVEAR